MPEGYDKLVVADIIVLLSGPSRASAPPTTSSYRLTLKSTTTIRARSYAIPTGTCVVLQARPQFVDEG